MPITPSDSQLHFGKRFIPGSAVIGADGSKQVDLSSENIVSIDAVVATLQATSGTAVSVSAISGKTFTLTGGSSGDTVYYIAVCTPA